MRLIILGNACTMVQMCMPINSNANSFWIWSTIYGWWITFMGSGWFAGTNLSVGIVEPMLCFFFYLLNSKYDFEFKSKKHMGMILTCHTWSHKMLDPRISTAKSFSTHQTLVAQRSRINHQYYLWPYELSHIYRVEVLLSWIPPHMMSANQLCIQTVLDLYPANQMAA